MPSGTIGMVVPNRMFINHNAASIRSYLTARMNIEEHYRGFWIERSLSEYERVRWLHRCKASALDECACNGSESDRRQGASRAICRRSASGGRSCWHSQRAGYSRIRRSAPARRWPLDLVVHARRWSRSGYLNRRRDWIISRAISKESGQAPTTFSSLRLSRKMIATGRNCSTGLGGFLVLEQGLFEAACPALRSGSSKQLAIASIYSTPTKAARLSAREN